MNKKLRALKMLKKLKELRKIDYEKRTDEQQSEIKKLFDELSALSTEIQIEGFEEEKRELNRSVNDPPPADDDEFSSQENRSSRRSEIRTGEPRTYRALFGEPEPDENFGGITRDFLKVVSSGRFDPRLKTSSQRAMNTSIGSEGGFLIPAELTSIIFDEAVLNSFMLQRCRIFPMLGSELKVSALDDANHSTSRSGLVALWVAEEGTMAPDDIDVRLISFKARKLYLLVKVSREWLEDAPDSDRVITSAIAKEIGWQLDNRMIQTGSGAGQPLSLLNGNNTIEVAKETDQAAASFEWENACKLSQSLNPAAEGKGIFLFSPSLKTELFTMSLDVGTGGAAVWAPALSNLTGKGLSLLGNEVFFTEHCKIAGTKGDAMLFNPEAYGIALRQDMRIESSAHRYFETDHVAFRCTVRLDAAPLYESALTLHDGTTSVSDICVLAAR